MRISEEKALGTYDLAKLARVYPATLIRWVHIGKLKPSFYTGGGQMRFFRSAYIPLLSSLGILLPEDMSSVLIVEDHLMTRRIIRRLIHSLYKKFIVHETGDGFEAGYMAAKLHPNLVILDLNLPGLDGLKVCRLIKKNDDLKWVKIIGITGNSPDESKEKFLDAGADDFLSKPFSKKELASKLEKFLISPKPEMGKAGLKRL